MKRDKENDIEHHNGIGLMYASDYGLAVGNDLRSKCLVQDLASYNNRYYYECFNNDWLYTNKNTWTMSYDGTNTDCAFFVNDVGNVNWDYCGNVYNHQLYVEPVVYLKSTVKITSNPHPEQEYGTVDNPFQLSNE